MKKDDEITNKVLLQHMQEMKVELHQEIQSVRGDMRDMEKRLSKKIDANTNAIVTLTEKVNALDEDLKATIHDTVKIRRYVGMPVVSE